MTTGLKAGATALPQTPPTGTTGTGNLAALGFTAIAASTGPIVPGLTTILQPNPASGFTANIASPFAAYTVFSTGATSSTGSGSFSSNFTVFTAVTTLPEPATLIGACVGLAGLGAYKLRRRQAAA
jgi:hypothetical protein